MKVSITCKLADFGIVTFDAEFGVLRQELVELNIRNPVQAGAPMKLSPSLEARLSQVAQAHWQQFLKRTYVVAAEDWAPVRLWS